MMELATGQLQCPRVAASFGDDLDLSSFYVSLDDGARDDLDGVGSASGSASGRSASDGSSCKSVLLSCTVKYTFNCNRL